jgi:hypothetical protein
LLRQRTDIAFAGATRLQRQVLIYGVVLGIVSAFLSWSVATVQRIINRHEGKIWAENSMGFGATFYFTV